MSFSTTLKNLIKTNSTEVKLKKGSSSRSDVKALQNVLYRLGYGKELNWAKYGADGGYGGSTTAAMTAFNSKNGFQNDALSVPTDAAKRMVKLYESVDGLRHLKKAVDSNTVESTFRRGSSNRKAVAGLQRILNVLGYGKELNWEKYGADGGFGGSSVAAVKAFCAKEGFAGDGSKLTKPMAEKILSKFVNKLGDGWEKAGAAASGGGGGSTAVASTSFGGEFKVSSSVIRGKKYVQVTDGTHKVSFRPFRKGVFTFGKNKLQDFINNNKQRLEDLDITDSAMNTMIAVSENEGNLDAINTWDNSFMTFGCFQWTIGARNDPGELPALFKKIKDAFPEKWEKYYGKYGLDIHSSTGEVYGSMTLNGQKIATAAQKTQFRTNEWSYIFWRAGQDVDIQSVEVEHSLSRLKTFYWKYKVHGFTLNEVITSEYGVGLILDNHVNRPGYVKPCIRKAMENTGLMNPKTWGTAEENKVIDAYIKVRATYGSSPMTHANNRAAVTKKYLDKGMISNERNSFQFTYLASRDADSTGVGKPMDMEQEDYPTIIGLQDPYAEY